MSVIVPRDDEVWSFIHVEDAAIATVEALTSDAGVYNLADSNPTPAHKWLPAFASWIGAPTPPNITVKQAREAGGDEAVYYGMNLAGASNEKAKRVLNFSPRRLIWL